MSSARSLSRREHKSLHASSWLQLRETVKRLNLLDHDPSIPGGDILTHLDDTYEGTGEHDRLVIAVALARTVRCTAETYC